MSKFTDINPYEMLYRNMGIQINQDITKEQAALVVTQLGFMHNAIGVVCKDIVRILQFRLENKDTMIDELKHTTRNQDLVDGEKLNQKWQNRKNILREDQVENRREQDKKKKTQAVSLRVENDELNKQFSKYELHTEAAGLAQDLRRKIDGNEWKYCEQIQKEGDKEKVEKALVIGLADDINEISQIRKDVVSYNQLQNQFNRLPIKALVRGTLETIARQLSGPDVVQISDDDSEYR